MQTETINPHETLTPEFPTAAPASVPATVEPRHPAAPVNLNDLAGRKGEAIEIVNARIEILQNLRRAALRMTSPEDWVLFRDKAGRVVGYLADAGCQRVRDLYGIEVFDVSDPVRERGEAPGEYFIMLKGSGRCRFTGQVIEGIWGGRNSAEDFNAGKSPMQARLDTLKAARANLDGQITRELAGLNSVPDEELAAAWEGSHKKVDNCRRGRGFGSQAERMGADTEVDAGVKTSDLPLCPRCGSKSQHRPGGTSKKTGKPYAAFLSCSNRDCSWTQNWEEWLKSRGSSAPAEAPKPNGGTGQQKTSSGGSGTRTGSPIGSTAFADMAEDDVPF